MLSEFFDFWKKTAPALLKPTEVPTRSLLTPPETHRKKSAQTASARAHDILWKPQYRLCPHPHNFKMAGAGASENDGASVEPSPANTEQQKKEMSVELKKSLRKGDTW